MGVNISLRQRVMMSFVVANIVILLISFLTYQYLDALNNEMDDITKDSHKMTLLSDEVRLTTTALLKGQRRILLRPDNQQEIDRVISLCDGLLVQLQNLSVMYNRAEAREIIAKMSSYVDSLRLILGKAALHHRAMDGGPDSLESLMDKILESFSDFQDIQYFENERRNLQIKEIIQETKQKMMIVLIIGFLGTIILGLVIPGKIALPFKKIRDGIRELQDCNFDVSIYYAQDDEIGEIAREMNKMIHNLKVFEELRADRIAVEGRKFDALANLVRKPVLLADAQGKLIYMNAPLYKLLEVQSEEVIGKEMHEGLIPRDIIQNFELAIKRRSKIENNEVTILKKNLESLSPADLAEKGEKAPSEEAMTTPMQEVLFQGVATVIPIRGKESSLDYYLMVLSEEVFT